MSAHDTILYAVGQAKMEHLRCEHFDHTEDRHIAWSVESALRASGECFTQADVLPVQDGKAPR